MESLPRLCHPCVHILPRLGHLCVHTLPSACATYVWKVCPAGAGDRTPFWRCTVEWVPIALRSHFGSSKERLRTRPTLPPFLPHLAKHLGCVASSSSASGGAPPPAGAGAPQPHGTAKERLLEGIRRLGRRPQRHPKATDEQPDLLAEHKVTKPSAII